MMKKPMAFSLEIVIFRLIFIRIFAEQYCSQTHLAVLHNQSVTNE